MDIRGFLGSPIMHPLSDLKNSKCRIQDSGRRNENDEKCQNEIILVKMYIREVLEAAVY